MRRPNDIHGGDIWLASRSSGVDSSEIIDFSASINPLGLPPSVEKAIKKAIKSIPPYPDPFSTELKTALAGFHGIGIDEVVPANGSNEIISLLPRMFGKGPALIIEPAFSEYRKALDLHGVEVRSLVLRPGRGFMMEAGPVKKALDGCSAVYIANPSNPAGVVTPRPVLLDIVGYARKKRALVIIDEAFADFTNVSVIPEAVKAGNVVVLKSMTKFYAMAGLRLGYAVGHKKTVSRLSEAIPAWSVNTLASRAGIAALADRAFRKKTIEWFQTEREFLFNGLSAIDGLEPFASSANYIMAKFSNGGDSREMKQALFKKHGILIRELSAFRGLGPEYFRVAVLGREDNKKLLSALRGYLKKG